MLILKQCPYYRNSETVGRGKGLGHCDLGGEAICDGDVQFCDRPEDLKRQILGKKKGFDDSRDVRKENRNYKVLVVDDQEPLRQIIVAFLSRVGHQCVTAGDGVEALNKMIQDQCDAVVTDIVMPEKDGITLTKELLAMYPNLPIMVMTGHSKEYSTESALIAGARDFISKPFSFHEFVLRFDKMMSDQKTLSQMEAKQNEMVLHLRNTPKNQDP